MFAGGVDTSATVIKGTTLIHTADQVIHEEEGSLCVDADCERSLILYIEFLY